MSAHDFAVTFPAGGVICLQSRALFGDVNQAMCRRFIRRVFQEGAVEHVTIKPGSLCQAEIHYCATTTTLQEVVARLVARLREASDLEVSGGPAVSCMQSAPGPDGTAYQYRRSRVAGVVGSALARGPVANGPAKLDARLPLCTATLPLAAAAQFAFPALLPAAAALVVYTSLPTLRAAWDVLSKKKRLGVDVLDAIVVLGCLGTMSLLPSALFCWCQSLGRVLVKKTQDESRRLAAGACGAVPQFAWLYLDGAEVRVALDRIGRDDIVVVGAGEAVPVDGHVVAGMALVDQHDLTGAIAPSEKGVGDRVFAATTVVGGKLYISVEKSGTETASTWVSQTIEAAAAGRLDVQRRGERLADQAVVPTLALSAVGMAAIDPSGALAVLKSNARAGVSTSAPLAAVGALALCASRGIVVKEVAALERVDDVATVLFEKSALLDAERLEVVDVAAQEGFTSEAVLQLAPAAERRIHHPIARAILAAARVRGLVLPPASDVQYRVGLGVKASVYGHSVCVGNARFQEREGVLLPARVHEALADQTGEGASVVLVGVDDRLAGVIELEAPLRTEVQSVMAALRGRGVRQIALLTPDKEAHAQELASVLGMDRYFADVRAADTASVLGALEMETGNVCFVSGGSHDSQATTSAALSISLRGASSLRADPAAIVFLEHDLARLLDLWDVARDLNRTLRRSWSMIVVTSVGCIVGVFTMGFGIMASVLINNAAALAALANDALPLHKVARIEAERRHRQELTRGLMSAGECAHH
jgi:Cu2+-exporting ATPase